MMQNDRLIAAAAALAAYGLFCLWIWWRARARGKVAGGEMLIAFASQTGMAEELARATAKALAAKGDAVAVCVLGSLTAEDLRAYRRVLFIASTTGEGSPPDMAYRFQRKEMAQAANLDGVEVAVLALGDRTYADFCGFGRRLDAWLGASGATRLFDAIEVDAGDPVAIARWGRKVAGPKAASFLAPASHAPWRLVERRRLNPAGKGDPVFLIALEPKGEVDGWTAGDVIEIEREVKGVLHHREYSIASLPADRRLELVVREHRREDGSVGLMSGWLTGSARIGATVNLRVRTNNAFHPLPERPRLLIGAGTGIAGLRGHVKAGGQRAWLVFGERSRAGDYLLGDEIEAALVAGALARRDLAFSRDEGGGYVQDVLRAQAADLRAFVDQGAAIFVCGSLAGMGHGVHDALGEILGAARLQKLTEDGLYRRDLY